MSKAKYKQGKRIYSIEGFEACGYTWYKWNGKTTHRSVLMSLQYRTLLDSIVNGRLYTAELIDEDKAGGEMQQATIDLFIKTVISDFYEYQKEWLTSHNDIEFDKPEEDLILGFLNDTAKSYIAEHAE